MFLRGEGARTLLETVAGMVESALPPGTRIEVSGRGSAAVVRTFGAAAHDKSDRVLLPGDRDYDRAARSLGMPDGAPLGLHSVYALPGPITVVPGLGPWVPFLPAATRSRLTVLDALETVQSHVSSARGSVWPDNSAKAYARLDDDMIEIGFNSDGAATPLGRLPLSICR